MKQEQNYDVIIIGGSYSGLSAALTLGRALQRVLIIDSGNPCNKQTPHAHNFLTNDGKTPTEIAHIARQQVQSYDNVSLLSGTAVAGAKTDEGFEIQVENGQTYISRKLVFASGIKDIMPDIPGFSQCWGISVLHCPYCHGYEVRQQKTGILANGDAGYELASLITNWTDDLTLFTNGRAALSDKQRTKLQNHKIRLEEREIEWIEHKNGYIQNIHFADGTSAPVSALYSKLPFEQNTGIPKGLGCELSEEGYIKIDAGQRTNVHGVFACGDNTTRMRTVANAVSMGTATGIMLNKELIEENF